MEICISFCILLVDLQTVRQTVSLMMGTASLDDTCKAAGNTTQVCCQAHKLAHLERCKVYEGLIGWVLSGAHEGDKGWAVFALAKEIIPGGAEDGLQLIIQLPLEPGPVCGVPHAVSNDAEGLMAPKLQHGILHQTHCVFSFCMIQILAKRLLLLWLAHGVGQPLALLAYMPCHGRHTACAQVSCMDKLHGCQLRGCRLQCLVS